METVKNWAVEVTIFIAVLFIGTAAITPKHPACKERNRGAHYTQEAASR